MFVILLAGMFTVITADTIPGGDVSGTWYQANSPYYITGFINIPVDDTLIIEPGVEVIFLGDYSLTAMGILNAVGTVADSILFFPENTSVGWQGIVLDAAGAGQANQLSYCSISYASTALVQLWTSGVPDISNCYFSNNYRAINWEGMSDLQVSDCVFRDNGTIYEYGAGFHISSYGSVDITGCLFENNHATIDGGAIWIGNWAGDSINITDCTFLGNTAGNEGGAIHAYDVTGTVTVENCVFGYNECYGFSTYDGGGGICSHNTDFDLSYCLFYENDGFYAGAFNQNGYSSNASVTMDHCTVWGLAPLFQVFIGPGGALSVSNSIFAHCASNAAIYICIAGGLQGVDYSDFYDNMTNIGGVGVAGFGTLVGVNYNGDSCDVYFNIFMDPMFEDTANFDFHLTAGSPCIDAGDTAFTYDPDGTVTDIGAYWFDQTGIKEYSVVKKANENDFFGATIFSGPLHLPEGKTYKVLDVTGRVVTTQYMKPGIYFIEMDGKITQKVVKIR
jgi:predicted outer membrane repeat protein